MVTLYNVIDIRDDNYYSVAVVKERNAKWFKSILAEGDEE